MRIFIIYPLVSIFWCGITNDDIDLMWKKIIWWRCKYQSIVVTVWYDLIWLLSSPQYSWIDLYSYINYIVIDTASLSLSLSLSPSRFYPIPPCKFSSPYLVTYAWLRSSKKDWLVFNFERKHLFTHTSINNNNNACALKNLE